MNTKKLLLYAIGLIVGAVLLFYLLGWIIGMLWYALIVGAVLLAGVVGYKLLFGGKNNELNPKDEWSTLVNAEMDLSNTDNLLDEYRQKLLLEEKRK